MGGEFLDRHQIQANCRQCSGDMRANVLPLPSAAVFQSWFPDPLNVDTWNLAAVSPWVSTYSIGVGDFNVHLYSKKVASWFQDDWALGNRLTLNLGLRYDLELGAFANEVSVPPFQSAGRPADKTNFQPRFGFNFKVNDSTALRGDRASITAMRSARPVLRHRQPAGRRHLLHQRRPAGLRGQSHWRSAAADVRAGAVAPLLGQPGRVQCVEGDQLRWCRAVSDA